LAALAEMAIARTAMTETINFFIKMVVKKSFNEQK
jgi:hypothetical protein